MSDSQLYPSLLCLRGYPAELRDALTEAAEQAGLSVNTYAIRVLADLYGVEYARPGRRLRAKRSGEFPHSPDDRGPGSTLQLAIPPELNYRIHEHAMRSRTLLRDLVLGQLASHLGMRYVPPRIKRGRKKAKVA